MVNLIDSGESSKVIAANYTVGNNDSLLFAEAISAGITVTLPNAAALDGATSAQGLANVGRSVTITKDASAFTVTIAAAGGSVLGGTNPLAASAVHSTTYTSDGVNWYCTAFV